MDGPPSPEDPYSRTYAFKSTCSGNANACVATGIRLNDQDPKQPAPGGPIVLDYLDGAWTRTYNNTQTCRGVQVVPLKHSAGEGLRGRYQRTITPAAPPAQPTTSEVKVTTGCIRNYDHCLTYVTADGVNGAPPTVEGYELSDGLWSLDRPFEGKCPDEAPVNGVTHTEFVEPGNAADPIAKLTGTQRDVADPCPGTTNADIAFERIGD